MTQKIYLAPLEKAIYSLLKALQQPKDEFIRDAAIQRFEYTYELSWKALKRYLEMDEGSETIDHLHRKDLLRMAAEKGLIRDVAPWFDYHECRNLTSHTYNENVAERVYAAAVNFAKDASELLKELEQHASS